MIVLGRGGLPSALGQPGEQCPGYTACPAECPAWCQPADPEEVENCDPNCPCPSECAPCPDLADLNPCCADGDDCETFPPDSECCDPANCVDTLVPLTDLDPLSARYVGHPLGLYIDDVSNPTVQTNTIPPGHLAAAMTNGSGIVPRNADGNVDWVDGRIGVLSLGFSNPLWEFDAFINNHVVISTTELNSRLVFVNGAEGATDLCQWRVAHDPTDAENPWELILGEDAVADPKLNEGRTPGGGSSETIITAEQVQVVWMKLVHGNPVAFCGAGQDCDPCTPGLCGDPECQFLNWVYHSEDGEVVVYQDVLKHIREYFPHVQQVFLSSRSYGGYANGCSGGNCHPGGPEPWAYTSGFTVQELVRLQIFGTGMEFAGPLDYFPLILWGPYLWAPGTTPNETILPYESTALSYRCWDYCANGAHPSTDDDACGQVSGRTKIASLLFNFFKTSTDPETMVAHEWFRPRPTLLKTSPFNATIDRLEDFNDLTAPPVEAGTKVVIMTFSHEVRKPGSGDVDTSCFTVTSTCADPDPACVNNVLPTVTTVVKDTGNPKKYTLTLDKQIVPGHWTTIIADVEMAAAPYASIRSDPFDRVDLGFLPGDTTADGTVTTADYDRLVEVLLGQYEEDLSLHDVNRDGVVTTADRGRLLELFAGVETTRAWLNYTLPARP